MDLDSKVVVITGSGGGIGEACARRFTDEGARVVVTDIDAAGVARVSGDLGVPGLAVDITEAAGVAAVAELARESHGEVDVWFSNAGYSGRPEPGDLQSDDVWDLTWRLHVLAHLNAAREVVPSMVRRGSGYLLSTASTVALSTQVDKVSYSVTKHAALSLAEWLAVHYRPKGIRVSCFCPGPMLTPMLLQNDFPADHPILDMAMQPEDVADLLVAAIAEERFLIETEPGSGASSLQAKAVDYDGWIDTMGGSVARRR